MNLSDDLVPAANPSPLLRALRRHHRRRLATRAGVAIAAALMAAITLWPRPVRHPASAAAPAPAPTSPSVTMTRDELVDSLKEETFALVHWPDGREQLLIRR